MVSLRRQITDLITIVSAPSMGQRPQFLKSSSGLHKTQRWCHSCSYHMAMPFERSYHHREQLSCLLVMHYHTGPITDPYNEIQLQHDFVRELKWFIVQKDKNYICTRVVYAWVLVILLTLLESCSVVLALMTFCIYKNTYQLQSYFNSLFL